MFRFLSGLSSSSLVIGLVLGAGALAKAEWLLVRPALTLPASNQPRQEPRPGGVLPAVLVAETKAKCRRVFNNLPQMFFLPSLAFNGISTEGGKSLAWALQQNASLRIFW